MNNLNDMVIFARVAETGVISEAARALDIPKSRVSRRVSELEKELNIRLIERGTKGVRLTEAGQLFYQHCRRIVEEARNASESLNRLTEIPRGRLKINASISLGQLLLVPRLPEFLQRFPEIDVDLILENRTVDLIAEGYDLALRVGDLQDSDLISRHLASYNMSFFASPDYLDKQGRPQNVQQLHEHKMLTMAIDRIFNEIKLTSAKEEYMFRPETRVRVNDLDSIRQMALAGLGIAFMPGYLADQAIAQHQLEPVLPEWGSKEQGYYLLYPSRSSMTPKLKAMIDFLLESDFASVSV